MEYLSIVDIKDKCTGCGACVNICPKDCVELRYDSEGFLMPQVEIEKCIGCGMCERSCQVFDDVQLRPHSDFTAYAGWTTNEQLRLSSSSGGFFSLLAQQVLDRGGVVFGAAYNYDLKRLEHSSTQRCDLSAMRKTKYIESNTLETFIEVVELIKEGREVLYCATPCQIAGLRKFMEVKRVSASKLLAVDFICHGVPSSSLYAQWLTHLEKTVLKDKVTYIDFRSKSRGWMPFSIVYKSQNRQIDIPYYLDYSISAFYDNNTLRRSCYGCQSIHYHMSDITIADFWGRKGVIADDNRGISLAVINSDRGQGAIKALSGKEDVVLQKLTAGQFAYAYKPRDEASYSLDKRTAAYRLIDKIGYVRTLKRLYGRRIKMLKLKIFIKKIILWRRD